MSFKFWASDAGAGHISGSMVGLCSIEDIDGTLTPKAQRVVLRQSRLSINSSPHIADHYMFVFNFITLLLLRYCCHIYSVVRCCRGPARKI